MVSYPSTAYILERTKGKAKETPKAAGLEMQADQGKGNSEEAKEEEGGVEMKDLRRGELMTLKEVMQLRPEQYKTLSSIANSGSSTTLNKQASQRDMSLSSRVPSSSCVPSSSSTFVHGSSSGSSEEERASTRSTSSPSANGNKEAASARGPRPTHATPHALEDSNESLRSFSSCKSH